MGFWFGFGLGGVLVKEKYSFWGGLVFLFFKVFFVFFFVWGFGFGLFFLVECSQDPL